MDVENEWEKYSNGVGRKILAKYGYKGKGLGKFEDGIKEPIKTHKRPIERGGLDYDISATKKQVTELQQFNTIGFTKSKDVGTSESDSEEEPQKRFETAVKLAAPSLPPIPDASLEQMDALESQISSIKHLVKEMEGKYSTQPIELPESVPFIGLTTGQADCLIRKLTSVVNILQNLTETSPEDFDFEQIVEIDKFIMDSIPELYRKLAIDQYILFIVYPYFKYQVSCWNFMENKPTESSDKEEADMCLAYLQVFRDQFNSWKNFIKKKISFQNHHLWNNVSQLIIEKLTEFMEDSSSDLQNPITTNFLVKLFSMWIKVVPSTINIEHKMSDIIQNQVNLVDLKDITKLHTWIVPWVHFFGQETMESVLVAVYSKLDSVFSQNMQNISIEDFSIIQTLLPWKQTLTTYLYQKLIKTFIVPVIRQYLRDFEINPSNQELKPLWKVFQWFDLFTGSHTTLDIYIKAFEDEFFNRWLNILYTWLSSTTCKYEECVLWYIGWKEFFELNAQGLYLHIYANFNNAVSLMNTLLIERKE